MRLAPLWSTVIGTGLLLPIMLACGSASPGMSPDGIAQPIDSAKAVSIAIQTLIASHQESMKPDTVPDIWKHYRVAAVREDDQGYLITLIPAAQAVGVGGGGRVRVLLNGRVSFVELFQ